MEETNSLPWIVDTPITKWLRCSFVWPQKPHECCVPIVVCIQQAKLFETSWLTCMESLFFKRNALGNQRALIYVCIRVVCCLKNKEQVWYRKSMSLYEQCFTLTPLSPPSSLVPCVWVCVCLWCMCYKAQQHHTNDSAFASNQSKRVLFFPPHRPHQLCEMK